MSKKSSRKYKILFVASEAVPFIKTGGLGDVCGALPKILRNLGHDVRLAIPRYWSINKEQHKLKPAINSMGVSTGGGVLWCQVLGTESEGVPAYFIEHEQYFGRAGLYDDGKWEYPDNPERFGFFSRACLQLCQDLNFQPDIIHCHDWQTALAAPYLKIWEQRNPFFAKTASVFSIHNIAYQGTFRANAYDFLGLGRDNFTDAKFENFGGINFMKGAIFYADIITTVSPTYAREILGEPGANGLSVYIQRRKDDLYGILNGVDYDHWNPENDRFIPENYSANDLSGKATCKEALQKEFHLEQNPKIPIVGIVSRFAEQKGLFNLVPVIKKILRKMVVQFVIVGSGDKSQEDFFGGLPAYFPGQVGAWIGYNNRKAHLIEAGADFFLMPSIYEPCGLNQIYSLKYGTLPIARATGGLKDTIIPYDEATGFGTGFLFDESSPKAIYDSVGWAVSTFFDRPKHMDLMRRRAMVQHFSWADAAKQYENVYAKAIARRANWW